MKIRMLMLALGCVGAVPLPSDAAQCPAVEHTRYLQFIRGNTPDGMKSFATLLILPEGTRGKQYVGQMPDPENPPYSMPCDCPATHQDCDNKPYDHVHYTHSLPLPATFYNNNPHGVPFEVTEAMAMTFWDYEYAGYQKQGGLDVSQNCYGYAFGFGTFILDDLQTGVAVVVQRCFTPTHLEMGDAVLAMASGDHCIRVDGLQDCVITPGHPPQKRLQETSEKFRESPIYTLQGNCPGVVLKPHVSPIENYAGGKKKSLEPYTLYKKKQ